MNYRQGLFVAVCVASSGCAAVLGLDDFKEGGAGGSTSSSSGASTGASTSASASSTASSSTSGAGGGCGAGTTDCGGTCATLATDPLNCGKCNKACDPTHPGASACVSSMCQACAVGMADCDGLGVNACESDLGADKKNCGVCGHACAGSCSGGHCQPSVLLAAQPVANAMILQGDKLYIGTNFGTLVAISVDGSGSKDVASDNNSAFTFLALDSTYAYWFSAVGTAPNIVRASLAGDGVIHPLVMLPQAVFESGLTVGATGVFYSDSTGNKIAQYDFMSATLQDVATMQPFASSPLVVGNDLFWTTFSPTGLTKKTLPGGAPAVICSKSAVGQLIASSTDLIFNGEMGISKVPINGANPGNCPTVLTSKTGTTLATDGTTVFWTDNVDSTIKSIPVGGGTVTTVGPSLGTAIGLAVDAKFLYWQVKAGLDIVRLEKNP